MEKNMESGIVILAPCKGVVYGIWGHDREERKRKWNMTWELGISSGVQELRRVSKGLGFLVSWVPITGKQVFGV